LNAASLYFVADNLGSDQYRLAFGSIDVGKIIPFIVGNKTIIFSYVKVKPGHAVEIACPQGSSGTKEKRPGCAALNFLTIALVAIPGLDLTLCLLAPIGGQRSTDVIGFLEPPLRAAPHKALVGSCIDQLTLRTAPLLLYGLLLTRFFLFVFSGFFAFFFLAMQASLPIRTGKVSKEEDPATFRQPGPVNPRNLSLARQLG
jgi:hypothetical protein